MSAVGKPSQCAGCGTTFRVVYEDSVLYCSDRCEADHDIFATKGVRWYEGATKAKERKTKETILYPLHAAG